MERAAADGGLLRVARLPYASSRNPYQTFLYDHLRAEGIEEVGVGSLRLRWLIANRRDVDLLHIHWRFDRLLGRSTSEEMDAIPTPVPAWRQVLGAVRIDTHLRVARRLGYRVAWTVHDLGELLFGGSLMNRMVARGLARIADVVLVHGDRAGQIISSELRPRCEVVATPIPHYADAHAEPDGIDPTRAEASVRDELGLSPRATVFLAFGGLRPDKDFELLTAAFRNLHLESAALVVVGFDFNAGSAEVIRRATVSDPRIVFRPGQYPDDRVRALFRLADVAVSARSVDWTPSSLVLALSLGVPVVAADLATNREAIDGGGWFFGPGDADSLTEALARSLDPVERARRAESGRQHVLGHTWEDVARVTAKALREAMTDRGPGTDSRGLAMPA